MLIRMNHGASIQWNLGELLKIMMRFLYIFCMLFPECSSFRELWGSLPSLKSLLNYYPVRLAFLHHFIKFMVPLLPLSLLYLFLIFLIFKNLFYFHQFKKNYIYKPLPLCFGSVFVGCLSPRLECKRLWGTWEAGLTVGPSEVLHTAGFQWNLFFPWMNLQYWPGKQCSPSLSSPPRVSWTCSLVNFLHAHLHFRVCCPGNLLWNNIYIYICIY